jgi:glycosidase
MHARRHRGLGWGDHQWPARLVAALVLTVAAAAWATAPASATPITTSDNIMMIMTDRYADGNTANDNLGHGEYVPGNLHMYQGGDWQGIINEMPYIKNLGITAIWISPVSDNEWFSRDGTEAGYHGYFTHDYSQPNPHFGDLAKLQELVSTAHANGIKVILDVVPNHTADYLSPFATSYSSTTYQPAAPFNDPTWYHHNGDVTDWNNQTQVENSDIGGLDDLDQSNSTVASAIENVYHTWFVNTGADAARVDAARSMPKSFLQAFETAIGVPTFGEIFQGDPSYVSDYQNYEWSVLDFPLFFNSRDVFAYDHSFTEIKNILDQDWRYPHPERLINFIDNHDRDRFLALADDNYQRLRTALTFMYTVRGIPDLYYATEQAYYGGGKPTEWAGIANLANREKQVDWNQNATIYKWIQRLTQIRSAYPQIATGTQREMWVEDHVYSYSRRNDTTGAEAIVTFNNDWNSATRTIPLRAESTIAVGTVLTNLLNTTQQVTVASGGTTGKQITLTMPGHDSAVWVSGTPAAWTPPATTVTTIHVHYNAGYGNAVWLRGSAYPFWWDAGRAMRNLGNNVWEWQTERLPAGSTVDVKALINDYTYQDGANVTITGGTTVDIYPTFHAANITRIRVHKDAGAGGSIALQGDTSPLSWTASQSATWSQLNAWTWETTSIPCGQKFEFKPLLNGTTYSLNSNYVGVGCATMDVYPIFASGETERNTETLRVVYSGASTMSARGDTSPLSWTASLPMTWTEGDVWTWETTAIPETSQFQWKPMRNGTDWSLGGNYYGRGGESIEVYSSF